MFKRLDNILLICAGVFVIGGIALVTMGNFFGKKSQSSPTPVPTQATSAADQTTLPEALKSTEILIPDTSEKVRMIDGVASFSGQNPVLINFISPVGMTKTADQSYDVFGGFAVNYGGSGDFVYVGLFHVTPSEIVHTSSTPPLGDRILVKSATASAQNVNDYSLTVSYLERNATESMADAPTVPMSKEFPVKNHVIDDEQSL